MWVDFRAADNFGFLVGKKNQSGKCHDLQED